MLEIKTMNNDVLRKVMLHMDRRTMSVLYPLTRNDMDCFLPVLDKYGCRLNTLSISRTVGLLNKVIELGKYSLVLEYLDRVSIDRMIRVLFKLVEKIGPEHMKPLFNSLKEDWKQEHKELPGRYSIIVNHIENIMNNSRRYRRYCYNG